MSTTQPWWKRFLGVAENEKPKEVAITRLGIVKGKTGRYMFCAPDAPFRGVKITMASAELIARYNRVTRDDILVQSEMAALQKFRRPRKRKLKIVSLPGNPEPSTERKDSDMAAV